MGPLPAAADIRSCVATRSLRGCACQDPTVTWKDAIAVCAMIVFVATATWRIPKVLLASD